MTFGEKIKKLRKEKGWSQEELSKKIGTDTRQVSLYENNKVSPSAETVVKIARTFNVSIDYLLSDDITRRPLDMDYEAVFEQFQKINLLTDEEKESVLKIIEGLAVKNKMKQLVSEIS